MTIAQCRHGGIGFVRLGFVDAARKERIVETWFGVGGRGRPPYTVVKGGEQECPLHRYLSSLKMSATTFHWPERFCQATTNLPVLIAGFPCASFTVI
jgi:hypothetical protein